MHVSSSTEADTICSLSCDGGNVFSSVRISDLSTLRHAIAKTDDATVDGDQIREGGGGRTGVASKLKAQNPNKLNHRRETDRTTEWRAGGRNQVAIPSFSLALIGKGDGPRQDPKRRRDYFDLLLGFDPDLGVHGAPRGQRRRTGCRRRRRIEEESDRTRRRSRIGDPSFPTFARSSLPSLFSSLLFSSLLFFSSLRSFAP